MPTDNLTTSQMAALEPKPKAPKKLNLSPVIDIAPETTQIRKRDMEWQEFSDMVLKARNIPQPEVVVPQATPRQQAQTEVEMAAGARRTAYFEEQDRNRVQIKPDATEGSSTPVFRPRDHVPGMDSKDPAIKTLK